MAAKMQDAAEFNGLALLNLIYEFINLL